MGLLQSNPCQHLHTATYAAKSKAAAHIPDDAAAATEHNEETTNLPVEKQLIYSIVNAFLGQNTFHHPQAEELLMADSEAVARILEL